MARIDPFLERLVAEKADRLELSVGQGAMVHGPRGPKPLLRQPLSAAQIAGALSEIVPDDLRAGFPRQGATTFGYDGPLGAFDVRIEVSGGTIRATITPAARRAEVNLAAAPDVFPDGPPGARRPASTPPPSPATAPRAPPPQAAALQGSIPNPPDPRGAIDALLTAMLERRASDLHLSSDSAPMLRVDGDMAAVEDYGPVGAERLKELVWAIAPEKNREEWHSRKDTDFAHETRRCPLPRQRLRATGRGSAPCSGRSRSRS